MAIDNGIAVPTDSQSTIVKKKTSSRAWILIDSQGHGTVLDVDKYDVMNRVHIHARDLRILDPLLSYPSTVLGRDTAIVLNLEHIKAVITGEEVLIRDPLDENVVPVVEELKRRLRPVDCLQQRNDNEIETMEDDEEEQFPFEFRALEVALESICSFLAARTMELETTAYPALDELTSEVSSRNLDRVRKLKSSLTRLTAQVQKVREELEQLLDDDDDMNDLYLTRKLTVSSPISASDGAIRSPALESRISRASAIRASITTVREDETNVEDLEMLLEAYFMQIDGTYNKLTTLRAYIDDTEDYINIQLDNKRNQLIQLELCVTAGTVCLSIYSLIAGIFGMNIPYTWNDDNSDKFTWVVCVSGVSCLLLFLFIIKYALQKGLIGK